MRYSFLAAIGLLTIGNMAAHAADCPPVDRQPATLKLQQLVASDSGLKEDLANSIALGQRVNSDPKSNPVASIEDYYDFIDALTTYNPQNIRLHPDGKGISVAMDGKNYCNWNILDILAYSYFLVDRQLTEDPRGQIQFKNAKFSNWMRSIAEDWGAYLRTADSAKYVPDFVEDKETFGKWYCPKAPYASFHDFFTRELCATTFKNGSRPVEGYADLATVASVADSTPAGWWPISRDGKIVTTYDTVSQAGRMIKGKLYNDVHTFITGGPEETVLYSAGAIDPSRFDGGVWTHQFLNVNNYHRLHVPVSGKVVYIRYIQSGTRMKSGWSPLTENKIARYDPQDTADWQFGQTRFVVGIETPEHGIVIFTPMGMAQVASVDMRDWLGEYVGTDKIAQKGWEFANFQFGGSDFVVIFEEKADFVLTAPAKPSNQAPEAGVNYAQIHQGAKFGCFGGITTCNGVSTPSAQPDPYPGLER